MANSEALSGVHSYVLWNTESTYNSAATPNQHFATNTVTFRPQINNNTIKNYGFSGSAAVDGRKVNDYVHGVLDLKAAISFKLSSWEWLEPALGDFTTDTYSVTAVPVSFTVASNIDNPGSAATDQNVTYTGGVVEDFTLRTSAGEPVTVDINAMFADASLDSSLDTRVALPTDQTYSFSGSTIELPNATDIPNIIDSVTLSVKNNWTMMAGLGSRLVQNALPKGLDITVEISLKYLDNALLTAALGAADPTDTGGPTEYASIELSFTNGTNTMLLLITGVPLTEFAQIHENLDPVAEDLKFTGQNITGTIS